MEGRIKGRVVHELGLAYLPQPSPGDVYLDLEGDPFVGEGGLEFLFGYAFAGGSGSQSYTADWALSRAEEKAAFERFVDFVIGLMIHDGGPPCALNSANPTSPESTQPRSEPQGC